MTATALTTLENTGVLLPVAQFKDSHDLMLDMMLVGAGGTMVVAPPYQAMSVGDTVTLSVELFFAGDHFDTLLYSTTLTASSIGQPIQWTVPQGDLDILFAEDHIEVKYSIVYVTPTVATESEVQTLHVIPRPIALHPAPLFPTSLLPSLSIKGFDGDTLDPDAYPDGITLVVEIYPGMQAGDYVMVYADGDPHIINATRIDQTTVDSQKLEITLGHEWLVGNTGKTISLMYQYARLGSASSSMPLALTLRKPLKLPHPLILGVTPEGEVEEYKGYLLGRSTTNGVTIDIPTDAEIGTGKVRMVWDGYKPDGHHIADPTVGNPKRFQIPKQYMPANLGKRLYVYYEVTPEGEQPYTSKRFDLHIRDIESGWPIIQITSPNAPGNIVSLKTVTDAVTFRLSSWTFMSEGQRVRISAEGLLQAGGKGVFKLREGAAETVTEDEYNAGKIEAELLRNFLATLQLNQKFDVIVEISFDGGFSYKQFPSIDPQLVE